MKIALIGADGQLGSEIVECLGNDVISFTIKDMDVTDYDSLSVMSNHKPNIIINTAGYVKVAQAEDDFERCVAVNAIGALNVARFCSKIGAINMYISTDYVFDGKKNSAYTEDDIPNPINVYGVSKYAGEVFTRAYSSNHYILRLASLFGKGAIGKQGNFISSIISKAERGEKIEVVGDVTMSPTYAKDVAINLKKFLTIKPNYGIYHFTNSGTCTWHEFAAKILEIVGTKGVVKKISSRDLNEQIRRPAFSVLENHKLNALGIIMRPWEHALEEYVKTRYQKVQR